MSTQLPETESKQAAQQSGNGRAAAEVETVTFVETALKLGGKSEEESRKTGALDRADEQVEDLFAPKYQTAGSPAHRAIWDEDFPVELFRAKYGQVSSDAQKVMDGSLDVVRRRRANGTLLDQNKKINAETLKELADVGYWGILVDKQYKGSALPFTVFARFLTQMATAEPTVAGLASVHGCIGAVDPLRSFGNAAQKDDYLPKLATGQRLSAFALTEPCAGSDLTALRTTARLEGNEYVVNGEKLFITNAIPGRTVGLVCLIEGKPAVLIADLPAQENEQFQIVTYGLYALKHSYNNGLKFKNFRVPKQNLLQPSRGDGLTIAYHGLNRGRVAVAATAAGSMRLMLADMLPWAKRRRTYGAAIITRELVLRRIGRLAGLIVATDALRDWCAWLLEEGYRGEMECTIAKIFAADAQIEAAIHLYMKTHGGRAFLHGHVLGDNLHEFLAPCIYEGEGEILGMGFFKSLIKEHGKQFLEPIGRALASAGIKQPNLLKPSHAMKLLPATMPYLKWRFTQMFAGAKRPTLPVMPQELAAHAQFAAEQLQKSRFEIDSMLMKHQLRLADRQCSIAELSARIQSLIVMLTTAMAAADQSDEIVREAAVVFCDQVRREYTGSRPTHRDFRKITSLGEKIADGAFRSIAGIEANEILQPYED